MDHQWPKVVPDRVVLLGPQVALGKAGRNIAALGGFARKTADLG